MFNSSQEWVSLDRKAPAMLSYMLREQLDVCFLTNINSMCTQRSITSELILWSNLLPGSHHSIIKPLWENCLYVTCRCTVWHFFRLKGEVLKSLFKENLGGHCRMQALLLQLLYLFQFMSFSYACLLGRSSQPAGLAQAVSEGWWVKSKDIPEWFYDWGVCPKCKSSGCLHSSKRLKTEA